MAAGAGYTNNTGPVNGGSLDAAQYTGCLGVLREVFADVADEHQHNYT